VAKRIKFRKATGSLRRTLNMTMVTVLAWPRKPAFEVP
jgi:hypothetical protein